MNTVILVPRRAGFDDRDRLWKWCEKWWTEQLPDVPIFQGHHDHGLFCRSAAVNQAAQKAGQWDVALIIDSDVILDAAEQAMEAARAATRTGKLVVAFTLRHNLNRLATQRLMEDHPKPDWSRGIERTYTDQHSSVIAVPRPLWDEVGGFDEGFRGWGHEDSAFAIACETFTGTRVTLQGLCWHLWHQTAGEKMHSPARMANWNRVARYKEAWGDKVAMRSLLLEAANEQSTVEPTIPPILHRVVPEVTHPQAERWWTRFGELHPTWRLMTWRDPLDPDKFPLTGPYWPKCKAGAQLADLVRLEVLLGWGGVYVDQDVEPFRPLDPLLGVEVFAAWEDERVVPNAVLGARRDHPAIRACLDLAIERIDKRIWMGGPGVTTDILTNRSDVLLLPPEAFYPTHYADPDRNAKMVGPVLPWTFARHAYWASWTDDPHLPPEEGS